MSTEVDNQIVKLTFDNKQFKKETGETITMLDRLKQALNFGTVKTGLNEIKVQLANLPINALNTAADTVSKKFSAIGTMADQGLRNLETRVESLIRTFTSSLNIFKGGLSSGFSEYETQINAVQTIWANTKYKGTTMDEINSALDELNTYADKTIYNFTQMTRNIGTFTAAGVDLETSVKAIQGIANLSAMSGASAEDASRAMYQLSQALAAGKVGLQDWNSVVNANIGGKTFQKVLIQTAEELGTISGSFAEGLKNETLAFRDTLKEGWITSDVLTASLAKFTDVNTELGKTATDAATKVKTFTQLIDTLKETVQSGWTQTWEYIIGDFESARELFTKISDSVSAFLQPSMDARNEMLKYWSENGKLGETIKDNLKMEEENKKEIDKIARRVIRGDYGNGQKRFDALDAAGYDHRVVQNAVNAILGLGAAFEIEKEEAKESEKALTGREMILKGLTNIGTSLLKIIKTISLAFKDVFPPMIGVQLVALSEKFLELTERLKAGRKELTTIRKVFRGFFSIIKIGVNIVTSVLGGLWDILSYIFSGKGSSISKGLENFANFFWILSNKLEKEGGFDLLREGVFKLGMSFGYLIGKIKELIEYVSKNGLANTLSEGFQKATAQVKKFKDSFLELISSLFTKNKKSEKTNPVSNITNDIQNGIEIPDGIIKKLISFGKAITDAFGFVGTKIYEAASWFINKVVGIINKITLDDIAKIIGIINKYNFAKTIASFTKFISSFEPAVKAITDGITGIMGSINSLVKSGKKLINAKAIEHFAKSFLYVMASLSFMVAGVVALTITAQNVGDLSQGLIGMTVIVGLMIGLMAALSNFSKTTVDPSASLYEFFDPSLFFSFIGAVAVIGAMVAATVILGKCKPETIIQGLSIVAVMVGLVIVLGYFFETVNKNTAGMKNAGKTMIELAVAINLMILPLTAITAFLTFGGENATETIWKAMGVVAAMGGLIGLVVGVLSAIPNTGLAGVADTMIAFGIALTAMTIPLMILIHEFGEDKTLEIWGSVGVITVLILVMGAMTGLISTLGGPGGSNILAAAASMLVLAVAINLLMLPIKLLSGIDTKTLWKVVGVIGALIGIFTVFTIIMTVIDYFAAGTLPLIFLSIAAIIAAFAPVMLGIAAIVAAVAGLIAALNKFAESDFSKFGDNVKAVLTGIQENIPLAGQVIRDFVMTLANVMIELIPVIWELAKTMIYEQITNIFGLLLDLIGTLLPMLWQFILDLILAGLEFIGDNADTILATLAEVIDEIAAAIENNTSDLVSAVNRLMDAIWNLFMMWAASLIGRVAKILDPIVTGIHDWIEEKKATFKRYGQNLAKHFSDGIERLKNKPKEIFEGIWNTITEFFSNTVFGALFNIGSNVMEQFGAGVDSKAPSILDKFSSFGFGVLGMFGNIFDIHSPSGETEKMGGFLMDGFGLGIKEKASGLWEKAKEAGSGLLNSFKESLGIGNGSNDGIIDTIKSFFGGMTEDFDLQSILGDGLSSFTDGFDLQSILGDNLNLESTITPVLDMDSLNSQMGSIGSSFDTQSIGLSDLNGSFSGSYSFDNPQNGGYNDTNILTSINRLNKKLDDLAIAITNLHIRMDTGALVGSIVGDMDTALGNRMALRSRGV